MHRPTRFIELVALPLFAMAVIAHAEPETADATVAIVGRALSPSPLEGDLRRLTDEIGGRVSGSPAMARALEWGLAAFRSAGVEARTESYTQQLTWAEGRTRLDVLDQSSWNVSLVSHGWSRPTPAGGIDAAIVPVGMGSKEEYAHFAGRLAGAIVLVDSKVIETWADLSEEYDRTGPIIERAIKGGARAILWTGARARRLLNRHTDTVNGELSELPMATVAREDGLRLARLASSSARPLRVHLELPNVIGGPVEVANVVAEIRGREHPDEIVVLGAHLDSWDLGTGALDNGCNSALVVAAARAIHDAGFAPRRTIRFVLFSGEEEGMLGSRAYVARHLGELDKTRAMLAMDAGVGRVTGFNLSGRTDAATALVTTLAPLEALHATRTALGGDLGTDNVEFMLQGVPTLVADQEAANYMENYHAASDTFDKVDMSELARNLAIMAVATYAIADAAEPIGPRWNHAQIDAALKATGLDKEMAAQGIWEDWQAGRRGRAP